MKLYDELGNRVGFYGICNWWFEAYPEDMFVKEPVEVIQIRELMKSLIKKSKVA